MIRTPNEFLSKIYWETALDLAHISADSNTLPCKCICPYCSSNLTIFEDITTTSAQWFYCADCEESGDTIELLSAYLKISIIETINLLISKGLIDDLHPKFSARISNYITKNINFRRKLLKFWNSIKGNEENIKPEHMAIMNALGINNGKEYNEAISKILGFSCKTDINTALCVTERKTSSINSGYNRMFEGKNWNNVCVIPAFDMPGRVKTLIAFGAIDSGNLNIATRHIAYKTWGVPDQESGLVLLENAITHKSNNHIVMTDFVEGLRLIVDHMDKYKEMPSISLTCPENSRGTKAWKTMLSIGKNVIVAGENSDPILAMSPALKKTEYNQPWDASWVGSEKWIKETVNLSKSQRVETSPSLKEPNSHKLVKFDGVEYEERSDGIYVVRKKSSTLVSDSKLKIDKVIMQGDDIIYEGTLTKEERVVKFRSKSHLIERKYSAWLKKLCIHTGLSLPYCCKTYYKKALAIAVLFNKPVYEENLERKKPKIGYIFNNLTVMTDGKIITTNSTKKMQHRYGELLLNEEMDFLEKSALGDENSAFAWAILISSFSNLIAARLSKSKVGIAVSGECFSSALTIGNLIGNRIYNVDSFHAIMTALARTLRYEEKGILPVIPNVYGNKDFFNKNLSKIAIRERNCILEVNDMQLTANKTIARWVSINDHLHVDNGYLNKALRKVTLSFLSWLQREKPNLKGSNIIDKAVSALTQWCNVNEIRTDGLVKGLSLISHDLDTPDGISKINAFKKIMSRLMHFDGIVQESGEEGVKWVTCKDFYCLCELQGIGILERGQLSGLLLEHKIIERYVSKNHNLRGGWLIKDEVLDGIEKES